MSVAYADWLATFAIIVASTCKSSARRQFEDTSADRATCTYVFLHRERSGVEMHAKDAHVGQETRPETANRERQQLSDQLIKEKHCCQSITLEERKKSGAKTRTNVGNGHGGEAEEEKLVDASHDNCENEADRP